MVPLQSPSPHPPSHISAPRPALHILATNTLYLRYSSNDSQWSPSLAGIAIDIPRPSPDIRPIWEGGFKNDKYLGLFLHSDPFSAHVGGSCLAECRRDGV